MTAVILDPIAFKARYPEFAQVNDELLQMYFDESCLYLPNCDCPISDLKRRSLLLNMLTAHIASLNGALNPNGAPSGVVGRANSATQGSVSVGLEYNAPQSASWYNQTPYGAQFYMLTMSLRSFVYFAKPTRW